MLDMVEDTKEEIRNCKSKKDKQYNDKNKKGKQYYDKNKKGKQYNDKKKSKQWSTDLHNTMLKIEQHKSPQNSNELRKGKQLLSH